MLTVTARYADRKLGSLLCANAFEELAVCCLQTSFICTSGLPADVLFVCSEEFDEIQAQNAIFVVRGKNSLPKKAHCKNMLVILDSSDDEILQELRGEQIKAITCGLGAANTFTFSSLTPDCVVVSLQRTLTAFDGTVIEPFEIPIDPSPAIEPFLLLAFVAVFCMLGRKNPFAGQERWALRSF